MKNYDESVEISRNPHCFHIPDHPYRILLIGGSRWGKINKILTEFIYSSKIDLNQSINYLPKREKKQGLKKNKSWKTFIDYSQSTDDVYENLEDYNLTKERKNGVGVWWYNSRYRSW